MNQSNYDQLKQTLAPERIEAYGTSSDSPEIILGDKKGSNVEDRI